MADKAWLTERYEEQRPHLRAVAYRMLGSMSEADDAVQDPPSPSTPPYPTRPTK